ncbi:ABC transporter ATP-binding protein [Chloroflexota bacterium]
MSEPLFRIEKLKKYFRITKGIMIERTVGWIKAVDGIDFVINAGETFALVGESGCGKTTTGFVILKLLEPTAGSIWFDGEDIAGLKGKNLKGYRKSVQAIFQDPYSSLSPRMLVRDILAEPLIVNNYVAKDEIKDRLEEAIRQVGLGVEAFNMYPHEFSGGQRQRIALARSLILKPKLVVLDEPVSALDVSIRAHMMNDMKDLQQQLGVSYLLIAHGLGTVRHMCHWIGVMYLGKIVEWGQGEEVFTHPIHPYTQALFSAALPSHPDIKRDEIVLPGEVPSPVNIPPGCRFNPRCFNSKKNCSEEEPILKEVSSQHFVACHL